MTRLLAVDESGHSITNQVTDQLHKAGLRVSPAFVCSHHAQTRPAPVPVTLILVIAIWRSSWCMEQDRSRQRL